MAKPGLSATDIGNKIGLGKQEANQLLKAQGFLDGEPNDYSLTPKGEEYGMYVDEDNGYGGYAHRQWSKRYFDPSILGVLDTSDEQLAQARAATRARRDAQRIARRAAKDQAEAEFLASIAAEHTDSATGEVDLKKVLLVLAAAGVTIGVTFGIYKGVKWLRRRWLQKAEETAEPDGASPATEP